MDDSDGLTSEMMEVLSQALLDNIQRKDTSDVVRFLQSLPENAKNRLFPFTDENKNHARAEDPFQRWEKFPYPFLHAACERGNTDVVLLLLASGADPSLRTDMEGTALEVATKHGEWEILKKLIEWEPKLIEDEDTVKGLLAVSCSVGHSEMAEHWLEKLIDLKGGVAPCKEDFVAANDPLIAACRGGLYEMASSFVEKRFVVISRETSFRTGQKFTPLLELWCESGTDESDGEDVKHIAKWNDHQLHFFDAGWLAANSKLWHTLVKINLSSNALQTIPEVLLWGLPCLEHLDLSHNQISKLPGPETLEQLPNVRLTHLKVSNNRLGYPALEIFMLPLLENLDLSHNAITSLNHKRFPSKLVNPADNELVWDCSNMTVLNLSFNQIIRVPQDISAAKSLKKLYISNNRLTKLPAPWDCPLTKLYASGNNISEVADMHGYWSRSLVILDLSHNKLTEIPWTICQLTALGSLNLANNHITKLPAADSWSIYSLRDLSVADNRLMFVENPSPSSPGSHKRRSLSSKLMKRTSAVVMMETAPGSVFYPSASSGGESGDAVVFPDVFRDCLVMLDLSNNQLQAVPPSICNLTCLQKLDLSGNTSIEKLPDGLARLKSLYALKLDGLKIKEPETVAAVMQEDGPKTRNILEKLNERLLKCSPYRGLKLMLVGPEKCGKTSVLACLTKTEPDDDHGINIGSWTLQNPTVVEVKPSLFKKRLFLSRSSSNESLQSDIQFSTWDLKGGELNSTIHQSFFTPRALYLLVLDLRDGTDGVEKLRPWLLNIQSRAPESAVIIVATHRDKVKRSRTPGSVEHDIIAKYSRRDGFPDISGIFDVTATNPEGEGIDDLRQFIYKCAVGMKIRKKSSSGAASYVPLVGRMVPHTYTVLKEIIANECNRRKRSSPPLPPIMKEAELADNIRKIPDNRIETGQDIEEAVEFLSTCGSLVHFSDHLQGLTNLYFLDPVWLYDILINVANIKSSHIKEGRIHKRSLENLYQNSEFGEGRFEEYLQLLQRLEILLPISRIEFLIPCRLPKEKPGQDLSPVHRENKAFQTLERLYKLPYTPPGLWSRLVSRVYVFLKFLDQEGQRGAKRVSRRGLKRQTKLKRSSRLNQSMRVGLTLTHTNITYWQQGVSVQHHAGRIFLSPITFTDAKPGIGVKIQCQAGVFKPMGFVVDQIENLIKEWYPGLLGVDELTGEPLIQRLVPCPVCRQTDVEMEDPYKTTLTTESEKASIHFSLSELALAATLKGLEEVECSKHPQKHLALTKLIPDLFLMDLPVRTLDKRVFDFDPLVSRSLGSGGFGEVFRAKHLRQDVAVKMLIRSTFFLRNTDSAMHSSVEERDSKKSSSGSDLSDSGKRSMSPPQYGEKDFDVNAVFVMDGFSNLRSEVATMSKLRHPCIIQLIGISIQHLCFAMELAPLGDLATLLRKESEMQRASFVTKAKVYRTILDRVLTYKIALQVARGVSYLHSKRIIYSDLKTDNVLLYSLALDVPVNIKLTDYGIARPMDLQGARGMAGPMGFCAPEILRGRTFTEKVDWFSYSMLLYHLISGAWPYDNLKSAIEVRNAVNMGVKPGFQFRDFTIVSLFPNLEKLMQKCWRDNPLERPSGDDIALAMEDASFMCLKNVICPNTSEKITCLQSGSRELHENSDRVWVWTGDGANRRSTKIHIKYFDRVFFPKPYPGSQANCVVQVGRWDVVGTKDNCVQLFGPPDVGPQHNVHLQDFDVDAEVLCLCYQPVDKEDIQGHLFAGLADGHVVIFKYAKAGSSSSSSSSSRKQEPAWSKLKTVAFENKRCNVLELVPERQELWIACGNKLRILSTKIMLLEGPAVTVTPRAERAILDLAHHHDNLFCVTEFSSRVLVYSMAKRQVVQAFQCGQVSLRKGDHLSSSDDSLLELEEEEEEDIAAEDEVGNDEGKAGESKSEDSLDDSDSDEFDFRLSYFSSSHQQSHSATLPTAQKLNTASSDRLPGVSRPFSDGDQGPRSGFPVPQVRSMLTVKDTLWIGTTTGETLVTCIDPDNRHGYKSGEVVAILGLFPDFGDISGPVRQLLRAGEDHVVAWQELQTSPDSGEVTRPHCYQLLVWQAWGCHDVWKFECIAQMLNEAERALQK